MRGEGRASFCCAHLRQLDFVLSCKSSRRLRKSWPQAAATAKIGRPRTPLAVGQRRRKTMRKIVAAEARVPLIRRCARLSVESRRRHHRGRRQKAVRLSSQAASGGGGERRRRAAARRSPFARQRRSAARAAVDGREGERTSERAGGSESRTNNRNPRARAPTHAVHRIHAVGRSTQVEGERRSRKECLACSRCSSLVSILAPLLTLARALANTHIVAARATNTSGASVAFFMLTKIVANDCCGFSALILVFAMIRFFIFNQREQLLCVVLS